MTEWEEDCKLYWGGELHGPYAHWCHEWDGLPLTALQTEFQFCQCYTGPIHSFFKWIQRTRWRIIEMRATWEGKPF